MHGHLKASIPINGRCASLEPLRSLQNQKVNLSVLQISQMMQSQGVATRLISVLEDEARRLGIKRLYSDVSLTARKFFLSKGFTLENEYSKKVGEVIFPNAIMGKQLG